MKAYTQGVSKEEFITELKLHATLDNFIKGSYTKGEKGCAVGCSLMSVAKIKNIDIDVADHHNYETYLGIPHWIACLVDVLFERLSLERSKLWPLEFSEAVNVGADLNNIKTDFLIFILKERISVHNNNIVRYSKSMDVIKLLNDTISALRTGNDTISALRTGNDTISALRTGNDNDLGAVRADSEYLAYLAVKSVTDSAYSVNSVALAVALVVRSAAYSTSFGRYADKLIELIINCKGE